MSGDIVERLRSWDGAPWHAWPDESASSLSLAAEAADEIERLRTALALAVGEVSTYGPYLYTSPEQLMEYFMQEARRER